MHLQDAVATWLITEYKKPGISFVELFIKVQDLFNEKKFHGIKLSGVHGNSKLENIMSKTIEHLFKIKIFLEISTFNEKSKIFITQKYLEDSSDEKPICSFYEYGYIGYLSALHIHGLTDRFPKIINYVVFSRSEWKEKYFFKNDFLKIYGKKYIMPVYPVNGNLPDKILKIKNDSNVKDFITKSDGIIRVRTIEALFIDCLREPDLCGGLDHVIDIYEEYGENFSNKLIDYTDKNGSLIDKARVGFILEKFCEVQSNRFQFWKKQMIRGGSRTFYSKNSHSSWYDPEWCISLNHERIASYGIKNSNV